MVKRAVDGEALLLECYRHLTLKRRSALLEYAQFLATRRASRKRAQPKPPPRPNDETVVHAIKRLMRSYPSLDRARLLDQTSRCLASHMVDGRAAREVIDELEALFAGAARGR